MKLKSIAIALFILCCIGSVGAVRENFQSWGATDVLTSAGSTIGIGLGSVGNITLIMGPAAPYTTWLNTNPVVFTYAAFDASNNIDNIVLLDSGKNAMTSSGTAYYAP